MGLKLKRHLSESQEQQIIFSWADMQQRVYPELEFMLSTLNGVKLSIGAAKKAKAEGNKKGVFDIIIPCARGGFCGLWIELKVGNNRPSKEQIKYGAFLRSEGYMAEVIWGSKDAIELIKLYLSKPKTIYSI